MRPHFVRFGAAPVSIALLISAAFAGGLAAAAFAASPTDWEGTRPIVPASQAPALDEAFAPFAKGGATALAGPEDGTWMRIAPPLGVGSYQPKVVFDPVGNRLITFGGISIEYEYQTGTVATFDITSGTWATLAVSGTPPPGRYFESAVYDPVGQRVILFGGFNGALLADVWQLSLSGSPSWSEIDAGAGPSPRAGCGAAYDATGQRLIVAGGFDGTYPTGLSDDVWALSLSGTPSWTQLTPAGPGPGARFIPGVAWNAANNTLVLYGGYDLWDVYNDVWTLSLGGSPAWTELNPTGTLPDKSLESAIAFDPASKRLVVFGGYGEYGQVTGDLSMLDLSGGTPAWSESHPTPTVPFRYGAGAVVAGDGRFYLYGGADVYSHVLADIWSIPVANPTTWKTWELLLPPRLQQVMVLDTNRDRLVSFGGTDGFYRNDTWTHSMVHGRGWDPLVPGGTWPGPRRLHTGIYDPAGDRLIMLGGFDDHLLGDLWQLSFAGTPTWTPLLASGGGPSPRGGHVAIYDPEGQRMIVFGGYDGVSPPANRIGDTWSLSLSGAPVWTPLATGPGPSARSSASATYDPIHHAMIVFGGTDPNYRDDAWSLSLDDLKWTLIDAGSPKPGAREENSLVFDAKRNRGVIFGGYNQYLANYGDLWALGLEAPAWSALTPTGPSPVARWGMKSIYDPNRDGMWLYGGWGATYLRDLWFLQWHSTSSGTIATVSASAAAGEANLAWNIPGAVRSPVRVERSTDGTNWSAVGLALPAASGDLAFRDASVPAGETRAWRARTNVAGQSLVSSPAWLTIPSTTAVAPGAVAFAIRPATATSAGTVAVWCSLPRAGRASVELLDVAGRRLDRQLIEAGAPGEFRIELGRNLPAGLFFARLSGDAGVARTKVLRVR